MKERPILYSAPMVLAKRAGRKTQTRRALNPQPHNPEIIGVSPVWGSGTLRSDPHGRFHVHAAFNVEGKRVDRWLPCPYGAPGDRLWGRETWSIVHEHPDIDLEHAIADVINGLPWASVVYRADANGGWAGSHLVGDRWRPSIFMPRWASRLLDEVVSLRVERLGEISEEDALAEGITVAIGRDRPAELGPGHLYCWPGSEKLYVSPRAAYFAGWDTINGKGAAAKNPWVWRVETKAVIA